MDTNESPTDPETDRRADGIVSGVDSWLSATVDVMLATLAWVLVIFPALSIGNQVLGGPLTGGAFEVVLGGLSVGGAYGVMTGHWSIGSLGEFLFVSVCAALGWGIVFAVMIAGLGFSPINSDLTEATLLTVAYVSAALVVYGFDVRLFD